MMEKNAKIYVAGHRGMVGSAIIRELERQGYTNIITRTHAELDLCRQDQVEKFFEEEKPEYVFLAAAKVGGIVANQSALADFMYENMILEMNVIHSAWKNGCKLDGWNEYFKPEIWDQAFINIGIDKAFYANRARSYDEIAPWDHMDMLFTKDFLIAENKKAHEEKTTAHCREKCAGCGINKCLGKACFNYGK